MTLGKSAYEHYQPAGKERGILPLVERCRILEVGFGSGVLMKALRERGNSVYGVDAGRDIVERARQQGFEDVHLLDVSEEALPFSDDFFDAVYCYEVIEHLTNPHRMMSEIRRVLKPGDRLFLSVPAQEVDMGYGALRHTFVYPGLLERHNLERFLMQMYFRIDTMVVPRPTDWLLGYNFILLNMKRPGKPDVVEVITKDWSVAELYGDILPEEMLRQEVVRELEAYACILEDYLRRGAVDGFKQLFEFVFSRYPSEHSFYLGLAARLAAGGKPSGVKHVLQAVSNQPGLPVAVLQDIKFILDRSLTITPL